jgi:phosphonate transport system substrate-binding protein
MRKHSIFSTTVCVFAILALFAAKFIFKTQMSPNKASANVVTGSNELVIALVPEKNTFEQKKRYHYITEYLSDNLNIHVKVQILHDYGEVCQAFLDGKADVGFFGSFSYGLIRSNAAAEPIARPVWLNGSSTYSGYLFVRKDSDIKTVDDMKDKRLALVHKATTAGYIFPLQYFRDHGVENLEEYFSKINFCGTHDAAAWVVYSGEAEIGACKNHVFNAIKEKNSDFNEQMVVLAESGEVPSNGMVVRSDLDPTLKKQLKKLLLNMHKNKDGIKALEGFKAKKFIQTTDQDYMPLYRMIDDIGIDLKSYWDNQLKSSEEN